MDLKHLKLFESFISNNDFLVEKDWGKFVPNTISVTKDGKNSKYKLRDSLKNLNSVNLIYTLDESESENSPTTLTVSLSFMIKNNMETPMVGDTFECSIEITMGVVYILGVKVTKDGKQEFIPSKADIGKYTSTKLAKLVNYISGNTLKIKTITK